MALKTDDYPGTSMAPAHGSFLEDLNGQLDARTDWRRLEVKHDDLTAGAGAQAVDLAPLSATRAARVTDVFLRLDEEFSGGGSGSVTASVGESESPSNISLIKTLEDVFTGAGLGFKALATSDKGTRIDANETMILPAGDSVRVNITADVDVNLLTTGELSIYVGFALL